MRHASIVAGLLLGAAFLATTASAAIVPGFYLGANGVWTDSQETMPSDFELGGNVSVSLQHRLSVVG
ncbi:MAG: hypothetical protein RI885_2253, partial [Actinomycetota bacterium]